MFQKLREKFKPRLTQHSIWYDIIYFPVIRIKDSIHLLPTYTEKINNSKIQKTKSSGIAEVKQ